MSAMTPLAERSPNTASSSPTKCTATKTTSPTKSTSTSISSEDLQPIKSSTAAAAISSATEEKKEQQESQNNSSSSSSEMPTHLSQTEAQNQTYISPSDNIMSPTTKKLSEIKGRRFANPNSKTQKSLFAKTVAKEGLRSQEKLDSMGK